MNALRNDKTEHSSIEGLNEMKDIFLNKYRKFSIRKLTIGTISVAIGLVFVNDMTGMSRVEASLSVEDSNYINQAAPNNGALVQFIRQALETISKAADSTVLPTNIQNLKNKVQLLSTKNESDYTESAWQEFQGKLATAKSKLDEAEKAYNKAVTIKPNASSYETTINELITSYPEYNTVVIEVRDGETTEDAENRHLTNIRRINQVLTAKYAELSETAQLVKVVLPSYGEDIAAQQLEIINNAENILELNKRESTVAQDQHADLMAGLLENHKVTLSNLSSLRGNITSEDQAKITAFLESHNPSVGETDVFQAFSGALRYKFNNDGTVTITYTDDGSSDTVPLSIFAKGGATQTDSPAATYSVTYNYVSGTEGKELPSSITAPAVVSDKHTGDEVVSPTGQTDVEDAANQGTWHFNGWDKASVTIGTTNETVTGTWNFIPAATYSVTYNYVSGTEDKELPSSITAPAVVTDKHTGDEVVSPTGQTDVADAANQGTWHFTSWDKPSVTVGTTDETVTGTWTFTATPGEAPGTTPGTTTPGEVPGTTPGTTTPGEALGTTPGTTTPGEASGTTHNATNGYMSVVEDKKLTSSKAEGWSKKDDQWLYQLEDGSHIVNEWKKINGTWYHFDNSGLMQTGWVKDNGTWYYLNQSGAMQTGWVKDNGTWYYLNDSGAMQTGWVKDNRTWYYLNQSGAMQTGWVKDNGTWYYLNQSGAMETGWFMISDKWYYANESGALAINTTTPDGYVVNTDGEWIG